MLAERTLRHGAEVASALLGLDRFFRDESGDEDGLVVLNMDRAGALGRDDFASYPEARRRFLELEAAAASLTEPDRRVYYADVSRSSLAFITWREQGLPFASQLRDFLLVPAEPVDDATVDRLGAELRKALTDLGYPGDLPAQCAAWEARHRVAPMDVPAVLTDLLAEAWEKTEANLLPIPADPSDGMRVTPVTGVSFNARCDYLSRSVELNTDPTLTRPGLKHLAVHEGCPGHYVQFKRRETLYHQGRAAADVLLSVVNTAGSSVFEGIADCGMLMADWFDNEDDRVQQLLNRHRAAVGTGAAWRRHALEWPRERVRDWLRSAALTGGEGWVANRIGFIEAPARAVLIWSYWWGEPTVAAAWTGVAPADRPAFVEFLHGRLHSNESVGMFA